MDELKKVRQWLCWRNVNGQKRPCVGDGRFVGSTHEHEYVDYETALRATMRHTDPPLGLQLAFCFTEHDPYVGIDLDDCIDDQGEVKEWAVPIIEALSCTYGEFSPSGTGIKFYARGVVRPEHRHTIKIGDGQVEMYSSGRFFAVTHQQYGDTTELVDVQDFIDAFQVTFAPTQATRQQVAPVAPAMVPYTDLDRRLWDYTSHAERHVEGGRNNAAFRLAGHLHTLTDKAGNHPSEDQVLACVQSWNQGNQPPLPDEEIVTVVRSSRKSGRPPEDKPPLMPGIAHYEIDPAIQAMVDRMECGKVRPTDLELPPDVNLGTTVRWQRPVMEFPEHLMNVPGFVANVVRWSMACARYPQPLASLSGALAVLATLTGRKVDMQGTRTNSYFMVLAPSGAGKDNARQCNKEILAKAGLERLCGPERLGSAAGLTNCVVAEPSILLQLDEAGKMLSAISDRRSPHLAQIPSILLQLFSSSASRYIGEAYADMERNPRIFNPNLVIYGTATPSSFWEGLELENLTDGLLSRFIILEEHYVFWADPTANYQDVPEEILAEARWWGDHWNRVNANLGDTAVAEPRATDVPLTVDARQRLRDHAVAIANRRVNENPVHAAIWSRTNEIARKLTLLRACSRNRATLVELEDADWGVAVANWLTRSMLYRLEDDFAENEHQKKVQRVLEAIRRHPDGVKRSAMMKQWDWLDKKTLNSILETLVESDRITIMKQASTGGRPAEILVPVPAGQ